MCDNRVPPFPNKEDFDFANQPEDNHKQRLCTEQNNVYACAECHDTKGNFKSDASD